MERVNISELKNRLSEFLRKVRAGQTILILDRDRPIAKLERVGAGEDSDDDRLAELERRGFVRRGDPGKRVRLSFPPFRATRSVVEALLEERREGR